MFKFLTVGFRISDKVHFTSFQRGITEWWFKIPIYSIASWLEYTFKELVLNLKSYVVESTLLKVQVSVSKEEAKLRSNSVT